MPRFRHLSPTATLVGEVIAPLFLIAGYKARIAALIVAFNMPLSVLIAHRDIVFMRNDFGGWMIALNVFYFMSLSRGPGKWDWPQSFCPDDYDPLWGG